MKATILFLIFTTFIFAVENQKILQKQIEKQLSILGDAEGAAQKCLSELKNENLNKSQKQVFQKLLKRAATQSRDIKIVREATAYLASQKIECNKLTQRLSFGLPENLDPNLNKNIREALEYQWKTINWKKPGTDLEVLNKYLMEIAENTNISQNARVQAVILELQINELYKNKLSQELYDRLQIDLQCPREKEVEIIIKKAFDRLYETACHYIKESHALSIGTIANLCYTSEEIPKKYKLNDIFKIQIYRFNKQIESVFDKYKNMEIEEIEKFSDEQINVLSNKIQLLEKPLNEIRKYVYENYEKQRIEEKQQRLEKNKIANEFLKELKIFAEEGPKENKKAMKARDELLKLIEKYPDSVRQKDKQKVLEALSSYPEITCNMPRFLRKVKLNINIKINSTQWTAWQYHGEMKKLESVIKNEKDPQLIAKYFQTIINKLGGEYSLQNEKYPGLKLAINTIDRSNTTVIMTNLIPYISQQLDEIARGEEEENLIINLADGIDNCVEALKNKLIIYGNSTIRFNNFNNYNNEFPWPGNKQCEFANSICHNLCDDSNLTKEEKTRKMLEVYNALTKTMRESSGFVPKRARDVTFLEFAEGLDKSVPLIYKCLSETKNIPNYFSSTFFDNEYRPKPYLWKELAQFNDLRERVNKYYQISLSSNRERIKLIIEKIMSFVRNVKADSSLSTNTVDWIKKLELDKPEISNIYPK